MKNTGGEKKEESKNKTGAKEEKSSYNKYRIARGSGLADEALEDHESRTGWSRRRNEMSSSVHAFNSANGIQFGQESPQRGRSAMPDSGTESERGEKRGKTALSAALETQSPERVVPAKITRLDRFPRKFNYTLLMPKRPDEAPAARLQHAHSAPSALSRCLAPAISSNMLAEEKKNEKSPAISGSLAVSLYAAPRQNARSRSALAIGRRVPDTRVRGFALPLAGTTRSREPRRACEPQRNHTEGETGKLRREKQSR